jgi:hypothetical protein
LTYLPADDKIKVFLVPKSVFLLFCSRRYVLSTWDYRYLLDLVTLIVLDVQVMVVCGLWYANYRIVRKREEREGAAGAEAQRSEDILSGKNDQALNVTENMLLD